MNETKKKQPVELSDEDLDQVAGGVNINNDFLVDPNVPTIGQDQLADPIAVNINNDFLINPLG